VRLLPKLSHRTDKSEIRRAAGMQTIFHRHPCTLDFATADFGYAFSAFAGGGLGARLEQHRAFGAANSRPPL